MHKRLATVVAMVLGMWLLSVPLAGAWAPPETATFNIPKPWGSRAQHSAIVNKVNAAIRHARPGSTILIATYLFDRQSSVDALVGACRNGVSVRVILDGHIKTRKSRELVAKLNGDNGAHPTTGPCGRALPRQRSTGEPPQQMSRKQIIASLDKPTASPRVTTPDPSWGPDQSYVKKCNHSCRGTGASMHSKFYVFSQTGKASDVIMVSSSNLNEGGEGRGWNDMYTFKNAPTSFDMYDQIHREMTQDDPGDDGGRPQVTEGPYTSRFFPWPHTGRKGDPVLHDLNKVGCHGPAGRTRVNVSMFWWAGNRGEYIASKLLDLAHSGCRVGIIYGAPSVKIATRLRAAASHHQITLYDSRWDFNKDHEVDVRTHSKYILVNGRFGGDAHSCQVMTGTANWNPGSLARGDENTLNIAKCSAWRQYINNWNLIRRHSRKLPYH